MIHLHGGDCRKVLRDLAAKRETFHACVTDPPYHLTAKAGQAAGFMGKAWDGGGVAFQPETWGAVWDVLRPGAYLAAFGGTRTFHRMAVAIEDAGFEIRDTLMWLYGTGFPKSHNQHGEWEGFGTALKPAWEPIILARKPLIGTVAANLLAHGCGALNIDGCRIPGMPRTTHADGNRVTSEAASGHMKGKKPHDATPAPEGRWPANVLHDGSDEVESAFAAFGERGGDARAGKVSKGARPGGFGNVGADKGGGAPCGPLYSDAGSPSRFFYSAKASAADRAGSKHPTVKPLALMRWLCTLITPPGGSLIDPFAGSGTTLQAAHECGCDAVGIEQDPGYQADIRARLEALETRAATAPAGPQQRDMF